MKEQVKKISVIIVHYFDPDDLEACVHSFEDTRQDLEWETIVVDNSPGEEIGADFQRRHPDVTVMKAGGNVGFAGACNLAARRGRGDFLLFVNPDARPATGTVSTLVEFMVDNPGAAAVSPVLTDETGCVTSSGEIFPGLCLLLADTYHTIMGRIPGWRTVRAGGGRRFIPSEKGAANSIDWIPAACLLVRRQAWRSVKGFDPRFFLYGEDKDLCLRLKQRGWTIHCLTGEAVIHIGNRSGNRNPDSLLHFHRSQNRFFRRHYPFPILLGGTLIYFTQALLLAFHSLLLMMAGREDGKIRWRQSRVVLSWYLRRRGEILGAQSAAGKSHGGGSRC